MDEGVSSVVTPPRSRSRIEKSFTETARVSDATLRGRRKMRLAMRVALSV